MKSIPDRVIELLELHETNRIVAYSNTLAKQIPESFAANAFLQFQQAMFRYEVVRVWAFWDGIDIHKINLPTIAALIDHPTIVEQLGHADGMRIRTVGISDTLFYTSFIDGIPTGDLNMGMRLDGRDYPWRARGNRPFDASGTTDLALPHIDADTYPLARRYVRCFELLEHGFYKETVIVAHALLDDIVQNIIEERLRSKGLDNRQSQELLIRAIKESRLRIYLGPLLKVLAGVSIDEIWPHAFIAIGWLNGIRNRIAHGGASGDHASACKAIFVSIKTVAALRSRNLVNAEFPPGMFRQARLGAAWTLNPEPWVPTGEGIEVDPFD